MVRLYHLRLNDVFRITDSTFNYSESVNKNTEFRVSKTDGLYTLCTFGTNKLVKFLASIEVEKLNA